MAGSCLSPMSAPDRVKTNDLDLSMSGEGGAAVADLGQLYASTQQADPQTAPGPANVLRQRRNVSTVNCLPP